MSYRFNIQNFSYNFLNNLLVIKYGFKNAVLFESNPDQKKRDWLVNLVKAARRVFPVCMYKWILFAENKLPIRDIKRLPVPYDCLSLIIQPKDIKNYSLKEIYQVKNQTFFKDYGTWNEDFGLTILKQSMYIRRRDFNNAELKLNIFVNQVRLRFIW